MSFHQLGAEGAFLVDAVKYQGSLQQVKVKSLKGNVCNLELLADNDFELYSDKRGIVYPKASRGKGKLNLTFATQAGETITLKRKNLSTAKDLLVHFKDEKYHWGLNQYFLNR
ncbi:MAG: hypothetical protein EB108_02980 [Actinobacteria bacterium]|nr:hypothetical protein [Actinomycetota bacterium]